MTGSARVPVPRLLSRDASTWLYLTAGLVLLPVGVLAWALLTQPAGDQVVAVAAVGGLVALVVALVWRRTWLDLERGLVVREVLGVWRRSLAWAEAEQIRLHQFRGRVHLVVRRARGRVSIRLPLVAADAGGERSQPPQLLRVLADQVARWAPDRREVVDLLRRHADHEEDGGPVPASPLWAHGPGGPGRLSP